MSVSWSDIGKDVANAAPILGTLLGGPAGGAIGALISSTLGTSHDPDAVKQALATSPDAAVKLRQIEADQAVNLQKLVVATAQNQLAAQVQSIEAVNSTMQTEDKTRVFSWRDGWGWISGVAFAVVVAIVCYIVIVATVQTHPELLSQIPPIVGAFSVLFGISSTVLGVTSGIEVHHAGMVDRLNAGDQK